jgi:hypothetical protein
LSAQNNINTIVKNIPAPLLWRFLPEIFYWQLYYLAVVMVRSGQLGSWLQGFYGAAKLFPMMYEKRLQIEQKRKVSLAYLEQIIFESEVDLKESKNRLNMQALGIAPPVPVSRPSASSNAQSSATEVSSTSQPNPQPVGASPSKGK